ncbi:E3 ubiquitin-protein ligase TRIM39-like protein [Homarus gammarus nudivirus]|uniref:E3 ubiquitin-protein ligase TRIM39-like protein n=1 Tax=Homarus gammarus nudivirus TaxID=2509616 RepID=A0A411HB62_9VIRU|nr:E3 ubiquitin-protein ligase TRIM39-like protein [Homarus gammarus nudivirus]QBB28624.1 E3 ubiquitin-protein ligase TRIM39-like protein [Homarus gammarus nudivirus]
MKQEKAEAKKRDLEQKTKLIDEELEDINNEIISHCMRVASAAIGNKLKDNITCPICFGVFKDPVISRASLCSHVFCLECINNWKAASGHDKCPVCRVSLKSFKKVPVVSNLCNDISALMDDGSSTGSSTSNSSGSSTNNVITIDTSDIDADGDVDDFFDTPSWWPNDNGDSDRDMEEDSDDDDETTDETVLFDLNGSPVDDTYGAPQTRRRARLDAIDNDLTP